MIDLASVIRSGDGIICGQACAEPQTLMEALVAQRAAFSGAGLFLGINYAGILQPGHADHLRLSAYCGIGHNRALADAGALEVQPVPYSRLGALIRSGAIRADVVLVQVSPPNARGEYSLGLAADYLVPALETARVVVAEVNQEVPWTHADKLLRREDFSLRVESSRPPAAPQADKSGPLEQAIAAQAARFIPEGATLEFGIGALPEAVCRELATHSRLSVHSGTVGDAVVDLLQAGAVAGVDCALLIGTRRLFDFARENPAIRLRSSEYTHAPRVLAGIDRFIAVNSAVEVDFTGQVNAEVARGRYVGAVGGALDFVRAANHSAGGAAITLVPASRVVEKLAGPVATPRSEAGIIVTERGAADLRGCSLRERERRLRAIS